MVISSRIWNLLFVVLLLQSCATTPIQGPSLSTKELIGDSKASVFVWWATQCPCVTRYESRIEDLARTFAPKGIRFYVIASNSDDDKVRIETVAQKRGFKLPIRIDEGAKLATELGARTTPTVVIVDRDGHVQYRGWIDNERQIGESGRIAYAENALLDIVEDRSVREPSSPIYGCRITKKLR